MPRPEIPTLTRGVVLRGVGFGVAVVLGAVAVWLIVTSDSLKWHDLGVLCGLWGLLIGAIAVGSRRGASAEHHADGGHSDGGSGGSGGLGGSGGPMPGAGLEVRSTRTQVEHAQEVAARRAHEARIEELLRQEIRAAVNREVGTLRAEIAQLRTDLLEKVGGQLRLEHIETTRVIGSDLEALQEEIRALKTVSHDTAFPASTVRDLGRVHLRPDHGTGAPDAARSSASAAQPERRETRVGRIVEVESSVVKTAVVDAATVAPEPARTSAPRGHDDAMTGPIRRNDQNGPVVASGAGTGPQAPNPSVAHPVQPVPQRGPAAAQSAAQRSPAAAQPVPQRGAAAEAQSAPEAGSVRPAQSVPPARSGLPATATPSAPAAAWRPATNGQPATDGQPATNGQPTVSRHRGSGPGTAQPAPDRPVGSTAPAQSRPAAEGRPAAPTVPAQSRPATNVPASLASPAAPDGSGMSANVADVFAGLPRLSRFIDDAPDTPPAGSAPPTGTASPGDPVSPGDSVSPGNSASASARPEQAEQADRDSYHGRRRRTEQEEQADSSSGPDLPRGQHASTRRRHRDDDQGQDLLAELLAREKH